MPDKESKASALPVWPASFPPVVDIGYFAVLLLHLMPIWLFAYVPTQDGPAHLANAVIIKETLGTESRYHEFFELRAEPLPNWTSHLLLAGLLYALPPLVAHKVFVSLYVLGFALSVRYFLGAFGRSTALLAPVGLLFLYNRCFLTGFYNYCLSLILFWVILGYCVRCRETFGLWNAILLMGLFWLAYFTHLLGYLLAGAGAAWLLAASPQRLRSLAWLAVALLPTALLAAEALLAPGLLGLREGLAQGPPRWWGSLRLEHCWQALLSVDQGLFEPYEAEWLPLGLLVLFFYEALLLALPIAPGMKPTATAPAPPRLASALLGVGIGVLYLVLPDFLSVAIGFLKARLVLLPPLLWLACLHMPQHVAVRRILTGVLYCLLAANLLLITRYFYTANQELAEFTAGINHVGHERTLFVAQARGGPGIVHYLEHAANYYCLTTGNVNLDNYQAELNHFPIKYRPGIVRGRGSLSAYPNRDLVDVILAWDTEPGFLPEVAASYRQIFQGGRLLLFERLAAKGGLDR